MLRNISLTQLLATAFLVGLCISLSGCGPKTSTTEPEMGSIEAYLEEHPEERVDEEDEAGDEDAEFDASGE